MKKTIRLTESDLTRIVKRVINEQQSDRPKACGAGGIKYMSEAWKAGALTKIEFDPRLGVAFIYDRENHSCGAYYNELKNIFM